MFFSKKPRKFIKDFCTLSNVNFEVKKGETVGIIGKNGSGKSTLLKILAKILTQTSGEVYINGKVSALLELGAGFNPEYTGIENIYLNGMIFGFNKKQIREKIPSILEFAEIGEYIDQPIKTYSSGMFVRLAFANAINVDPEILIVDEALSVGDYRFQAKCYKKFENFKKLNKTILFVTHDIDAVRKFCTRAIWLDKGKKILDGEVLEVTSKYMEFVTNNTLDLGGGKKINKNKVVPINRFGTNIGLIKNVESIKDEEHSLVFLLGQKVKIKIILEIPKNVNKDTAVSLGVKNKAGLDLFVLSTYDQNISLEKFKSEKLKNDKKLIEVFFEFQIYLNVGDYAFVASLEDRGETPIVYYDYLEGALYFSVISEKEHYGLFNVSCNIGVRHV